MRYHVIEGGRVVNTILIANPADRPDLALVPEVEGSTIGWLYQDGVLSEPPPDPGPVPAVVSDRQFFHACSKVGMVTQAEALAAVRTGDIPAELQAIVDAMPGPEDRFDAQMFLSGAVEFRRDHPLTDAVRVARGMTEAEVDDLFRLAASL